jgi:hypothetical protein
VLPFCVSKGPGDVPDTTVGTDPGFDGEDPGIIVPDPVGVPAVGWDVPVVFCETSAYFPPRVRWAVTRWPSCSLARVTQRVPSFMRITGE